jgi:hypothetical protein
MTERAVSEILAIPEYRKELSKWVRNNFTRKYDGMPGNTHGFNALMSLFSQLAVRHLPAGGPQVKKSGDLIRNSSALIIVSIGKQEPSYFLNAGRTYARVAIRASENGIASSALGASVLAKSTRDQVSRRFNIRNRAAFILRLGYAKYSGVNSPRWPIEMLIEG